MHPLARAAWQQRAARVQVGEPSILDGSMSESFFITHVRCLTPLSDNWGRALEILWRALESMGRALGRHLGGARSGGSLVADGSHGVRAGKARPMGRVPGGI